jgi:uncharacterized protein YlxW (UPF0749 family)
VSWQYEELQNMQSMTLEEFLHFLFMRERMNAQKRKTEIITLKKEMQDKETEIEKLDNNIIKYKKKLNSKTVQMAYRLKKIVTLNGLLLKKH